MKQSITFYFAMIIILLAVFNQHSCNSNAKAGYSIGAPVKRNFIDTTKLIGVFVSPDRKSIQHDIIYKIRFDSVQKEVPAGSDRYKKVWGIDSIMFIPSTDTIRDSAGKIIRDERGNIRFGTNWVQVSSELVWVSSLNVDSAVKRFQKFLVVDTTGKK